MKRTNHFLLTFVACAVMLAIAGCGDDKQVTEVKALPFSYPNSYAQDPNLTVDQALDTRKLCDSVKWSVNQTDRNQTYVEYKCDYKGISDSGFIERDKSEVTSAADDYQWTYGPDGQPALSYVGLELHYKNGSSKDFKLDPTSIMRVAADNKATSFDQAWSTLQDLPIPIKPTSPFTDTTYGNTLTALYPGQSAAKAAAYAYLWKGASKSLVIFGIDDLGYPAVEDTDEAKRLTFPVNPADVQVAMKIDPSTLPPFSAPKPPQLLPNKLFCINEYCYDKNEKLVGRAPASVLAQETASNGSMQQSAQLQQPLQALSQQAMQQAATAQAGAAPLPTGSSNDDWPAQTPCLQKLEDAARKQADAQGIDDTISIDVAKEMANTCKTLDE